MGAGQIGGLATLLDIDFNNAAGFIGVDTSPTEAHYVVYFLSHTMLFCMGSLIEAHVVLTAASCVYGERYKFDIFGGVHVFIENAGITRQVEHTCTHRGYNHSMRWESCSPDNIALLLLSKQFLLHTREADTDYAISRIRYGVLTAQNPSVNTNCRFYGWGSRRNGYLIPLLMHLRRVDVTILPSDKCLQMWNYGKKYLCLQQYRCKDDLGSVIECSGFLRGMMASNLIDRPCGVGFLDMTKYLKFLTCGVDDSRDILGHNDFMEFEFDSTTPKHYITPIVLSVNETNDENSVVTETEPDDPGPPHLPSTNSGEEPEPELVEQEPIEPEVNVHEEYAGENKAEDQGQETHKDGTL